MRRVVSYGSTSFQWLVFFLGALRVRVGDKTREHISRILELKEILLSFQTGFSLVNAAVVCAILDSISGFGTLIRYN